MADAVLIVLLLAAVAATVQLARGTVRHWRGQRAGRPYELPVDHRGTALRAGSAGAAAVTVAALGAALLSTGSTGRPHPAHAAAVRPSVRVPPAPSRTPEPAPPAPEIRTLGHPSGGTLQLLRDGTRVWLPPRYDSRRGAALAYPVVVAYAGTGAGTGSGAVDAGLADLYAGFVQAADRHKADLFVVVVPPGCAGGSGGAPVGAAGSPPDGSVRWPVPGRSAGPGAGAAGPSAPGGSVAWPVPGHAGRSVAAPPVRTAPTAPPAPARTPGPAPSRAPARTAKPAPTAAFPAPEAVLAEVASRYRVLSEQSARGVLGVGPQAACALGEAFGAPARYGAAVGVSGTYPAVGAANGSTASAAASGGRPWLSAGAPHPPLLLVTAAGETGARAGARRLRDELRPAGGGAVRTLAGVAAGRQEFAQAAAYFTERLDGPRRRAATR